MNNEKINIEYYFRLIDIVVLDKRNHKKYDDDENIIVNKILVRRFFDKSF